MCTGLAKKALSLSPLALASKLPVGIGGLASMGGGSKPKTKPSFLSGGSTGIPLGGLASIGFGS